MTNPDARTTATISWYDANAEEYAARTSGFSGFPGLQSDLDAFLSRLPKGRLVIDLGSGAGRDAIHIARAGHPTVALDASELLLRACLNQAVGSGVAVHGLVADLRQLPLHEGVVAGIWACASLLHLRRDELSTCLDACARALMPGGWIGISMQEGVGEEWREGRLFTYVTVDELSGLLQKGGLVLDRVQGPDRGRWLLGTAYRRR